MIKTKLRQKTLPGLETISNQDQNPYSRHVQHLGRLQLGTILMMQVLSFCYII